MPYVMRRMCAHKQNQVPSYQWTFHNDSRHKRYFPFLWFPLNHTILNFYLAIDWKKYIYVSVAVKSLVSDFPQALGSVLPLSFLHLPIILSVSSAGSAGDK